MKKKLCMLVCCLLCAALLAAPAMAEKYTATADGFGGTVSVTLTIEDGKIVAAAAEGASETAGIGFQRHRTAARKDGGRKLRHG